MFLKVVMMEFYSAAGKDVEQVVLSVDRTVSVMVVKWDVK